MWARFVRRGWVRSWVVFGLLAHASFSSPVRSLRKDHRDALDELLDTGFGETTPPLDNWGDYTLIDEWEGLEVDHASHLVLSLTVANTANVALPRELALLTTLTAIRLTSNLYVAGSTIPPEFSALTALQTLILTGVASQQTRALGGSIPVGLGSLGLLQALELQDNLLTGAIPSELARLNDLQVLNVRGNLLSGSVPAALATRTASQGGRVVLNCEYNFVNDQLCRINTTYRLDLHLGSAAGSGTVDAINFFAAGPTTSTGSRQEGDALVAFNPAAALSQSLRSGDTFITTVSGKDIEDIAAMKMWLSGGTDTAFLDSVRVAKLDSGEFSLFAPVVAEPLGTGLPVSMVPDVAETSSGPITDFYAFQVDPDPACSEPSSAGPALSATTRDGMLFATAVLYGGTSILVEGAEDDEPCPPRYARFGFNGCSVTLEYAWEWSVLTQCQGYTIVDIPDSNNAHHTVKLSLGSVNATRVKSITYQAPASADPSSFVGLSPGIVDTVCGNGDREEGEECDDGNVHNGDCCSEVCTVEITDACVDITPSHTPAPSPAALRSTDADSTLGNTEALIVGAVAIATLLVLLVVLLARQKVARDVVKNKQAGTGSGIPPPVHSSFVMMASQSDFLLRQSRDPRLHLHEVLFPRIDRTVLEVNEEGRFQGLERVKHLPDIKLPRSLALEQSAQASRVPRVAMHWRDQIQRHRADMEGEGSRSRVVDLESTIKSVQQGIDRLEKGLTLADKKKQLKELLDRNELDDESSVESEELVQVPRIAGSESSEGEEDAQMFESGSDSEGQEADLGREDRDEAASGLLHLLKREAAVRVGHPLPGPSALRGAVRLGNALHTFTKNEETCSQMLDAMIDMVAEQRSKEGLVAPDAPHSAGMLEAMGDLLRQPAVVPAHHQHHQHHRQQQQPHQPPQLHIPQHVGALGAVPLSLNDPVFPIQPARLQTPPHAVQTPRTAGIGRLLDALEAPHFDDGDDDGAGEGGHPRREGGPEDLLLALKSGLGSDPQLDEAFDSVLQRLESVLVTPRDTPRGVSTPGRTPLSGRSQNKRNVPVFDR